MQYIFIYIQGSEYGPFNSFFHTFSSIGKVTYFHQHNILESLLIKTHQALVHYMWFPFVLDISYTALIGR